MTHAAIYSNPQQHTILCSKLLGPKQSRNKCTLQNKGWIKLVISLLISSLNRNNIQFEGMSILVTKIPLQFNFALKNFSEVEKTNTQQLFGTAQWTMGS